jgi:peroxiredoxin/outer membrane lipoprotein-sorting protein
VLSLSGLAANGASADPTTSGQSLLDQAQKRLAAAKSLSADIEEIDSYPGKYKDLAQRGTIQLSRTNLLRLDIHRYRRVSATDPWQPSGNDTTSVSDGKSYWYAFVHPHSSQVRKSVATTETVSKAVSSIPYLTGFFAATSGIQPGSVQRLDAATWEGATYEVVQYTVASEHGGAPAQATAYIGSDQIIHRLVSVRSTDRGPITREWNLRNIHLDDTIPVTAFQYTPPADATELATTGNTGPLAEGEIAPDFTVTDRSGRPVKLSDYRGKTVVLDFWATWCWPCNQSLPSTNKTVESYRSKNVVALAVAIRDNKKGFDTWVSQHSYPALNFLFDGETAGPTDPATLYKVESTPTTYVIGPDGRIVRSIVGFSGPTNDLANALDAALPTTGP